MHPRRYIVVEDRSAWMVIGQGAGVAAALAANDDVTVQELDYAKLRDRLLAQKQVLDLPEVSDTQSTNGSIAAKLLPGIVLDDSQAKLTGNWSRSTNFKPHIESGYVFSGEKGSSSKGDGKSTAIFRFKSPKSGRYQLLMAYSAHETRAKNVPVGFSSGTPQRLRGRPNRFTSPRQTLSPDRYGGYGCGHRDDHSDHQLQHGRIRDPRMLCNCCRSNKSRNRANNQFKPQSKHIWIGCQKVSPAMHPRRRLRV